MLLLYFWRDIKHWPLLRYRGYRTCVFYFYCYLIVVLRCEPFVGTPFVFEFIEQICCQINSTNLHCSLIEILWQKRTRWNPSKLLSYVKIPVPMYKFTIIKWLNYKLFWYSSLNVVLNKDKTECNMSFWNQFHLIAKTIRVSENGELGITLLSH